jgi:hypothetical protein
MTDTPDSQREAPPAPDAEPVMDIHKPKPFHSWREFLKEYGIIVLGVLTALALEQTVEWFHWRHEAEAERTALMAESRDNVSAVVYRLSEEACINQRLAQLAEVFRRHQSGRPLGLKGPVGRPILWIATTGTWQTGGQGLEHIPLKEKLAFSDAFDAYQAFNVLRNQEDDIWRRLSLLDQPEFLSEQDWATLHTAYADARGLNQRMRLSGQYVVTAAILGQKPSPPKVTLDTSAGEAQFCRPLID